MKLNPFDDKYDKLMESAQTAQKEVSWRKSALRWKHQISQETLQGELSEINKKVSQLRAQDNSLGGRAWRVLGLVLESANDNHRRLQDAIKKRREKQHDIELHARIDVDRISAELPELVTASEKLSRELEEVKEQKEWIDRGIAPALDEIRSKEEENGRIDRDLKEARRIDGDLFRANNSYEKAMAHQECERIFGDGNGSPRKMISKLENQRKGLNRTIKKLEARAHGKVEQMMLMRRAKKLWIDGNNMCYEDGEIIGLAALQALVPVLTKSYDVGIVFDASIRSIMKTNDAGIRSYFGDDVIVHIVSTGSSADKPILERAGAEATTCVISNDKFRDFWDMPVVAEDRILRHEIFDGHVTIDALDLNIQYAPQQEAMVSGDEN